MNRPCRDPLDRFWEKVLPEPNSGCWLWTGYTNAQGYGKFNRGGNSDGGVALAHRFAYEAFRGPIPGEMPLDHLCRVRPCVNPWHTEAVPQRENWRRSTSPNAVAHRTGVCKRGHPATPENIYVRRNGFRFCRPCAVENSRALRRTRHAA